MSPLDPELLALLLEVKAQMEADVEHFEKSDGWMRSLATVIAQDGMPVAWDKLVAYLREHGHAV